jgi:hypothetical protein
MSASSTSSILGTVLAPTLLTPSRKQFLNL